jgi:hypothetical protein
LLFQFQAVQDYGIAVEQISQQRICKAEGANGRTESVFHGEAAFARAAHHVLERGQAGPRSNQVRIVRQQCVLPYAYGFPLVIQRFGITGGEHLDSREIMQQGWEQTARRR